MRHLFAIAALAAFMPLAVLAADAAIEPVNRILDIAQTRSETTDAGGPDYFDKIDRDFSKKFVATYKQASKFPAYDGGDSPFDYDVITASQDGCPLKDIKVASEDEKNGVTVVDASFKLWTCADDASRDKVSQLKFDVVMEDGKPVISDIHRDNDGKWDSLMAEMNDIIKSGQQ